MAETLRFSLVSPERMVLSVEAVSVTVPGTEGQFGVLAGHAPVMTSLRPGMVDVELADGSAKRVFIRGGFAEVASNELTVLAEEAIPEEDLDVAALDRQIKNAEEDVADASDEAARQKAQECLDHLREVKAALSM